MHYHIFDRIHLVIYQSSDLANFERDPAFEYLRPLDGIIHHLARSDDFGPPDLGSVFDICQALEHRLQSTDRLLALITSSDGGSFTKTVCLVGAYIIIKMEMDLEATMLHLEPALSGRNASDDGQAVRIRLKDCLGALQRAKNIGWLNFGHDTNSFDVDEYRQLDSPLNADMHEIVPGKLIIMRGPRDLPGGVLWRDVARDDGVSGGRREFSPAYYADILSQLDVQAVLRCNAPAYDRKGFESAGIAVVDLCCEDGAPPPIDVMSKFLAVVERLPGAVAVHCGSGRGRSGALAGLYLMKHHGFTAREAVGWLQIVRPGWYPKIARSGFV